MTSLPPGPGIPRVLQLLQWVRRPLPFMEECARAYGDCFTIGFPGLPGAPSRSRRPSIVSFPPPRPTRELSPRSGRAPPPAGPTPSPAPPLGEPSLLFLDGSRHLRERRMMQPPFHGERMQAYGEVMRDITASAVDGW